ncbi:hypothetical protein [Pannonibacter phragmitetus]|uniref:hypothetical protein n=1 Tax=Pannonibacter phragmitetus TaxID=121719 RepID=UPI0011C048DB|nr:hypothetical protein [Pannonibacter phragmitetus]
MASMPQLSGMRSGERMAGIQGLQCMTPHGVDAMIKSWHDENGCVVAHFPLRERGGLSTPRRFAPAGILFLKRNTWAEKVRG